MRFGQLGTDTSERRLGCLLLRCGRCCTRARTIQVILGCLPRGLVRNLLGRKMLEDACQCGLGLGLLCRRSFNGLLHCVDSFD